MNEPEEYLKAYIHVKMTFYNEFLGWDPAQYGGIESTELVALENLWIPDIFAYNGVDMKNENQYFQPVPKITTAFQEDDRFNKIKTLASIDYSYPRIVKFSCSFDTFYFPFDYQLCVLIFRSWAHPKEKIYIVPGDHEKNYTKDNDEWVIKSVNQNSRMMKEKSSGEVFSVYQEEILLQRRPLYYIVNLIIPSIIITQVAFFGFFSPSSSDGDRTEKVNLGMGTLLAMSVLLLTVCGMTPVSSSHIPLMGVFFLVNMVLISLGVFMTTVIMMVHQRGKRKKRVPQWIQSVFFFRVAPLIGLKIPTIIRRANTLQKNTLDIGTQHKASDTLLLEKLPEVKQLSEHLETIINGRRRELAEVEFIFLARILDALMLILFSVFLYMAMGSVIFSGAKQNIPEVSKRRSMQWDSVLYNDERRRLDEEFMQLFDANPQDGMVDAKEFFHIYEKIFDTNSSFFREEFLRLWSEFDDENARLSRNMLDRKTRKLSGIYGICIYAWTLDNSIMSLFDVSDRDSNQKLERGEFLAMCYKLDSWFKKARIKPFIVDIFQKAHSNQKEYFCSCWFYNSDLNGDSYITAVEQLISLDLTVSLLLTFSDSIKLEAYAKMYGLNITVGCSDHH